uniref:Uncharacterized protein n=1 Tax=Arundo donax TaxID=35708 RepID=A0A0A8XXF4_ARUDO
MEAMDLKWIHLSFLISCKWMDSPRLWECLHILISLKM